jgi:Fe2+ or Zn2+ uptake regulation protein
MRQFPDGGDVPKVDNQLRILKFLYDYEVPAGPKSIYGGLIHNDTITFGYRTVQNQLKKLVEKGEVQRVKVDTDNDEIKVLDPSESGKRAFYLITEKGRQRVKEEFPY